MGGYLATQSPPLNLQQCTMGFSIGILFGSKKVKASPNGGPKWGGYLATQNYLAQLYKLQLRQSCLEKMCVLMQQGNDWPHNCISHHIYCNYVCNSSNNRVFKDPV
jgi:hypothetical protein